MYQLYSHRPIRSVRSLGKCLGYEEASLRCIATNSASYYHTYMKGARAITPSKMPLKPIQSRIKDKILRRAEYPPFVCGGIEGRSVQGSASIHLRSTVLITMDIANFFPSVTSDMICHLFKYHFRFSPEVAELLTQLTTYDGGLPQGVSTSSHLANLVLLAGGEEHKLFKDLEKNGCTYTRYIDDIAISSKRNLSCGEKTDIIKKVTGLVKEKGLRIKNKKTRVQGSQDKKELLGYRLGRYSLRKPDKYTNDLIKDCKEKNISQSSVKGKLDHIALTEPKKADKLKKADAIKSCLHL